MYEIVVVGELLGKIKYQKSNMYQIVVVEAFLHGINRGFYTKELSTLITWSCTYFAFDIL